MSAGFYSGLFLAIPLQWRVLEVRIRGVREPESLVVARTFAPTQPSQQFLPISLYQIYNWNGGLSIHCMDPPSMLHNTIIPYVQMDSKMPRRADTGCTDWSCWFNFYDITSRLCSQSNAPPGSWLAVSAAFSPQLIDSHIGKKIIQAMSLSASKPVSPAFVYARRALEYMGRCWTNMRCWATRPRQGWPSNGTGFGLQLIS